MRNYSIGFLVGIMLLGSQVIVAGPAQSFVDTRPTVRWRGFNLLGMFVKGANPGNYEEEDFQMIHDLGFNFVRLPMDYRFWIKEGDWEQIDAERMKPIDQAIAWGKQYGIHTQLSFHRAPGYTVARPPEKKNLFKDEDALRVCAKHWAFFAKRYKGISSKEVSFNLFNEPSEISEADYERVATALVDAIRKEDPTRFIIADGIAWGGRPAQSLFKLGIGQATRGYKPMSVTHYRANWVGTPSEPPVWPPVPMAVSPLYGAGKKPWNVPLMIEDVPAGRLEVFPSEVSGKNKVRLEADGKILSDYILSPTEGPGWTNVVFKKEWHISQGRCTGSYSVKLPVPVKRLALSISEGDWAGFRKLTLTTADGKTTELLFANEWGRTNACFRFTGFNAAQGFQTHEGVISGEEELKRSAIIPWQPAFDAGITVMVGEFGVHHYTPHGITLALMEDYLKIWKERNLSWALWNFKGSFGILDSGRKDVQYEDFHGHKLDRKMLELLQKY
ncbi:MAG: cellulase family glycosylhydrolase [bacterium]